MASLNTELGDGSIANIKAGSYLGTEGTIVFTNTEADDDGLFMRINDVGAVIGYRAPDQDLHWPYTNNTADLALVTTDTEVCTVTIDQEITPDDGSWSFVGLVKSTDATYKDLYYDLKEGTNVIATATRTLQGDDTETDLSFYGSFNTTYPAGTEFKIVMRAEQDGDFTLNPGGFKPSTLKITKARAAPVTQTFETDVPLGNSISRIEIDAIVGVVKDDFTAFIIDKNENTWFIKYIEKLDKFAVKRMNLK